MYVCINKYIYIYIYIYIYRYTGIRIRKGCRPRTVRTPPDSAPVGNSSHSPRNDEHVANRFSHRLVVLPVIRQGPYNKLAPNIFTPKTQYMYKDAEMVVITPTMRRKADWHHNPQVQAGHNSHVLPRHASLMRHPLNQRQRIQHVPQNPVHQPGSNPWKPLQYARSWRQQNGNERHERWLPHRPEKCFQHMACILSTRVYGKQSWASVETHILDK